jgi:hypothetical protein
MLNNYVSVYKIPIIVFSYLLVTQFYISAQEIAYDPREYLEYESFGYNAVEHTYWDGSISTDFYMLNNPLYSNMRIWDADYGVDMSNPLSPILGSTRYHLMDGYREYGHGFLREWPLPSALNHYYDRYDGGYTGPEGVGILYEIDRNGRMISARHIGQYRETITAARSVRYNSDGSVIIDFGDWTVRYYNISQQELVTKYLIIFTQATHRYLNQINDLTLQGRTKEELAIIRNLIYAKYNYNFQTPKWKQFIITYYNKNYQGLYSNQEVMDMLNEDERWLLERIIYYENR